MRRLLIVTLALLLADTAIAFERQPNADYRARRDKLAAKLGKGVLVLFASTEAEGQNATRGFRQNDDFYYLTGWSEPGAALVIGGGNEILFLPAHNVSQEKWTGPKLSAESADAKSVTGFDRVDVLDHLRDELVKILPTPSAAVYPTPGSVPIHWLQRANAFPNYVSFSDASSMVAELRVTKDAGEIALLRKAALATVESHKAAARAVKPGASENEIAAIIEYEYKRRGCEGPAFSSIVGSGFNSTVLHYASNAGTMKEDDVVVIDIGGEYSMYAADVTRTLPVSGKFNPRQREIYDIVLGAQKAAVDAFKAGTSTIGRTAPNSLYKVAMDYINAYGKDRHGQPLGQYFIHGLSHYVGLAVHDAGDNARPLQPGAVFTIEPGIYIPEESLGVRIEDTYLVKEDGTLECISCGAPK
ncbi:MAG TPA: Xaa-Pro peptidase family protein [Thermoanaerobaculia bacterium]|nr:Xaa-Pro peptidase family protein [Thermoanaerobaculia bacterium]